MKRYMSSTMLFYQLCHLIFNIAIQAFVTQTAASEQIYGSAEGYIRYLYQQRNATPNNTL
jgi:hypothetical protein